MLGEKGAWVRSEWFVPKPPACSPILYFQTAYPSLERLQLHQPITPSPPFNEPGAAFCNF